MYTYSDNLCMFHQRPYTDNVWLLSLIKTHCYPTIPTRLTGYLLWNKPKKIGRILPNTFKCTCVQAQCLEQRRPLSRNQHETSQTTMQAWRGTYIILLVQIAIYLTSRTVTIYKLTDAQPIRLYSQEMYVHQECKRIHTVMYHNYAAWMLIRDITR